MLLGSFAVTGDEDSWLRLLVFGGYPGLALMCGAMALLFWARLLWPSWRSGTFSIERDALGLSSFFLALGVGLETVYYGTQRWFDLTALYDAYFFVGIGKACMWAGAGFGLIALGCGINGCKRRVALVGALLWAAGVAAAAYLEFWP